MSGDRHWVFALMWTREERIMEEKERIEDQGWNVGGEGNEK
jgi:hypothetical protein